MALVFFGKNNPNNQCPAVHVDPTTGTFYMQGDLVTDSSLLAEITANSPMLEREAVVALPPSMATIIMEAAREYLAAGEPGFQRPVAEHEPLGAQA